MKWCRMSWCCCLCLTGILASPVDGQDSTTWIDVSIPQSTSDLLQLQTNVQRVLQKSLAATVAILPQVNASTSDAGYFEAGASGVIISAKGLVLSQAHVSHRPGQPNEETGLIELRQPGDTVDVVLHDGRRMKARLLGADYEWDLSMLQIIEKGEYPFLAWSDQKVSLGQWTMKLGHPLGYRRDRGTVVRLGRVLYSGQSTMVTDCQTTGGDSGGPIVDLEGRVIGLAFNSEQPQQMQDAVIRELPNLPGLFSSLSVARIRQRIPAMVKGGTVRRRDFNQLMSLRKDHSDAREFLSLDHSTHGQSVNDAWADIASQSKGNVVEILRQGVRAAFGTVVNDDGVIVTKASEIDDVPQCRLPNGEIVGAKTVGTNASYDIAFLRVPPQELRMTTWSEVPAKSYGQLFMTPDLAGKPLAWGILSAPENIRSAESPDEIQRAPIQPEQSLPYRSYHDAPSSSFRCDDFPIAFEHDMPLLPDQCGGPIFDLSGNVIGITIARSGPQGCIAIPASVIQPIVRSAPVE